jgi:glycosyltransferase involved in cell wall biosynthesis
VTPADRQASLAIVIPAFNEAEAIGPTLEGLLASSVAARAEVIVVDDGSRDGTAEAVRRFPVTLLRHPVNKGYGAALKTGIRHARAEKIITMDSDGQHTADALEKICAELPHCSMVIGERTGASHQVRNRLLGKRIIRLVGEYLVEQKLPDFNSGLRGFDRKIMRSLLHLMPNGFSFSTTATLAFLKQGYVIGSVPIETRPRVGRESNVRIVRDGLKTLLLLLRVIMLFNPLKIFLPASLAIGLWGLYVAVMDIWTASRVSNGAVAVMVMAMLLFFFGLLADQVAMLNLREREDAPV